MRHEISEAEVTKVLSEPLSRVIASSLDCDKRLEVFVVVESHYLFWYEVRHAATLVYTGTDKSKAIEYYNEVNY